MAAPIRYNPDPKQVQNGQANAIAGLCGTMHVHHSPSSEIGARLNGCPPHEPEPATA